MEVRDVTELFEAYVLVRSFAVREEPIPEHVKGESRRTLQRSRTTKISMSWSLCNEDLSLTRTAQIVVARQSLLLLMCRRSMAERFRASRNANKIGVGGKELGSTLKERRMQSPRPTRNYAHIHGRREIRRATSIERALLIFKRPFLISGGFFTC